MFKSTNLEYLDSTSWKKCCLKFYINCIRIENEFHSLIYLTSKVDIIILRFSGILGRWYLSVSILNLWLLDRNFAPAWRCFSFLIRSKYSDLLTSALKVEFIEIQFFVSSQHVHMVLFEVINDSLLCFWQFRFDQFGSTRILALSLNCNYFTFPTRTHRNVGDNICLTSDLIKHWKLVWKLVLILITTIKTTLVDDYYKKGKNV